MLRATRCTLLRRMALLQLLLPLLLLGSFDVLPVAEAYTPGTLQAWYQRQQQHQQQEQQHNDIVSNYNNNVAIDRIDDDTAQNSRDDDNNMKEQSESKHDKNVRSSSSPPSTATSTGTTTSNSITMEPIGTVSSVYRLCVGTPRQGLLAPNSRGRIELDPKRISPDAIMELDQFSHVWIVFVFHLNSNISNDDDTKHTTTKNGKQQPQQQQFPSKIRPPALGGKKKKVGIFATRTPHRPNPVGFTLCQLDKIVRRKKKKHEKPGEWSPYEIQISGLDLVDGTPVLDIKPYVPHYDSVVMDDLDNDGYDGDDDDDDDDVRQEKSQPKQEQQQQQQYGQTAKIVMKGQRPPTTKVPNWIQDGLEKRRTITFTETALTQLQDIVSISDGTKTLNSNKKQQQQQRLEFYGVASGRDTTTMEGYHRLKSCIEQVLAVDVRSVHQTQKARQGKFKAERTRRVAMTSSTSSSSSSSRRQHDNKEGNDDDDDASVMLDDINGNEEEEEELCTQQLDRLLIRYSVKSGTSSKNLPTLRKQSSPSSFNRRHETVNTDGSGADDVVEVREIDFLMDG